MANNRLWIVCRKCEAKEGGSFHLAKYYPLSDPKDDSFGIGGADIKGNAGWFVSNDNLAEDLGKFFVKHKHKFDRSNFGGWQYDIRYEITGSGQHPIEQIFGVIQKSIKPKKKK